MHVESSCIYEYINIIYSFSYYVVTIILYTMKYVYQSTYYVPTYIFLFTKISVELQIRSNRVYRGFLSIYSPLSSTIFIWNPGNQKLGLYYVHV